MISGIRQRIESIIQTTKSILGLERHGARTLHNLRVRICVRLLALTACVTHNHQLGLPAANSLPTPHNRGINHLGVGVRWLRRSLPWTRRVIHKLREADRMLGEGRAVAEVAKALEVSEPTYHRWRNQYGGMKADDAKRLKELERWSRSRPCATPRRTCAATTGRR